MNRPGSQQPSVSASSTSPAKNSGSSVPGRAVSPVLDSDLLTDQDVYLFNEGTHRTLYSCLGAHLQERDGQQGTHFAVWAPNAETVTVIGDFNGWDKLSHPLKARGSSGIWQGFIPGVEQGTRYKYHIHSRMNGYEVSKADPFGVYHEIPPQTASVVWGSHRDWQWNDGDWMESRGGRNSLSAPISIYEVHPGSWRRKAEDGNRSLTWRELAHELAEYVNGLGYTHVELMPVMEHPFFGSWGYQITGYFAPTSRMGTPEDFKYLVDYLHQHGIGVILDWVPSHYPNDEHGLNYFDGSHLYEHADPRQGFHPDWNSCIFNYGRNEVRSFLLSNALYWLSEFHIDGLRVDAVASMLYLDYSRKEGEWIPNRYGGRENLEAISLMRMLNQAIYELHPDVQTFAEESTAWPMVSRPAETGGLGFGLKWDMGWMHDSLRYFGHDPIHRKYHHGELTFRMIYAFNENFVLPLSHDEVVHGKGSLLDRMPGDDWQKFANLRLLFGYMYGMPGKKMLFMGGEFGQWTEWQHDATPQWELATHDRHQAVSRWVASLNRVYRDEPALHTLDCDPKGFEWIDANDWANSVLSFLRIGGEPESTVAVVCNFTPIPRKNYRVGVPFAGRWTEILNSDATEHGGSGHGNMGEVTTTPVPYHGRPCSLNLTLPPLGTIFLKYEGPAT
ncbi:MAG: 1,4-alpha-glucan branching protein GlgB [Planctomycetaceae bacterium]|nr:1,4-alpha-glucan branching protein GlgB [Planctomycetaceae bacterium]